MSYEIIKHIKVDEKENKVMVNCASNNVYPKDYYYEESKSLSKILKDQGRMALDIEILKAYESGCFQKGNNRYTSALKRLHNMPEYQKFNWRNTGSQYDLANELRKSKAFDSILRKALESKFPKDRYVISKKYGSTTVYAHRLSKWKLSWTSYREKAKIFHYKKEAESLQNCFNGSDDWNIELIKTKNDCAKEVTRENAYEVWQSHNKEWTWYVLKKWQINDDKDQARWFCDVVTPICPDGEKGDVWVKEIKQNAVRIK